MRNSNTHSLTMKKKLKKDKSIFYAYNELQYRYGIKLDDNPDILEIQANIKCHIRILFIPGNSKNCCAVIGNCLRINT